MRALFAGERRLSPLGLSLLIGFAALQIAFVLALLGEHRTSETRWDLLHDRCLERVGAWQARQDNLRADLGALRGWHAYYAALADDPSLAPSVLALVADQRDRIGVNIRAKRHAITADVPPNCDQLRASAQGER